MEDSFEDIVRKNTRYKDATETVIRKEDRVGRPIVGVI